MNKTIWKYPLKVKDEQGVTMPIAAQILTVQAQGEDVCLWAMVDPDADKEIRHIEIFGTGNPIPYEIGTSRNYISTFQLKGGALVFHAFEYTGV